MPKALPDHPHQSVVKQLQLEPVDYQMEFSHYVQDGVWMFKLKVAGLDMYEIETQRGVISDLNRAAEMIQAEIDRVQKPLPSG